MPITLVRKWASQLKFTEVGKKCQVLNPLFVVLTFTIRINIRMHCIKVEARVLHLEIECAARGTHTKISELFDLVEYWEMFCEWYFCILPMIKFSNFKPGIKKCQRDSQEFTFNFTSTYLLTYTACTDFSAGISHVSSIGGMNPLYCSMWKQTAIIREIRKQTAMNEKWFEYLRANQNGF